MLNRAIAFLSAAFVAAGLAPFPGPAHAAHAGAPVCADLVEIIGFRGSGEDQNNADGRFHEWLGPKLKAIVDEGRSLTTADGVNLAHTPTYGVPLSDYPAIPLSDYLDINPLHFRMHPAKMLDSAYQGSVAAHEYMMKSRRDCPGRRFILIGYSQGATAARATLRYVPESWIAGVFLIGDPELRPDTPYAKGTGGDDSGGSLVTAFRFMGGDPDKLIPDQLADRKFPTYSYCHEHDIVCDARLGSGGGEHSNYGTTAAERRELANTIVDMYRRAKQNPPPVTDKPVLDVVFAIDTTGSMSPYITNALESADKIAAQLRATSSSFQVGLVEYRDHGDAFVSRTVVPLSAEATAFRTGLDSLIAAGGGDTPEAVYSGMLTAAGAGWRAEARRIVIVIGDAPAHDPEPVTGYTKADVIRAFTGAGDTIRPARFAPATSSDPIRLYGLAADDTLVSQLSAIATETGGTVSAIDAPDEVATKIAESLTDATSAPDITLGVPSTAYAGKPVTITATDANNATGLTYEWDLNGDGTTDEATTSGMITHTYDKPGTYTLRVQVRDAQNRRSSASSTLTVLPTSGAVEVPLPGAPLSPSPTTPSPTASPTPKPGSTPTPSSLEITPAPTSGELGRTGSPIITIALIGAALLLVGAIMLVLVRRRQTRTSIH